MNQKYYLAKVGNLWVTNYYETTKVVQLGNDKKFAGHLSEDKIEWLSDNVNAELIEVTVTIKEKIITEESNES